MWKWTGAGVTAAAVAVVVITALLPWMTTAADDDSDAGTHDQQWTASWGAAVQEGFVDPADPDGHWGEAGFEDHSVRQVVRLSVGGSKLRLRLSNAYGSKPLEISGATLARSDGGAKARPDTFEDLTFDGSRTVTIPAGEDLVTDEIAISTSSFEQLAVTLRLEAPTGPTTMHRFTTATSFRVTGEHLYTPATPEYTKDQTNAWYYVSAVEVAREGPSSTSGAFMVFGDSLFDGVGTPVGADARFSDALAERLRAAGRPMGSVNASIAGNSLLSDSRCFGPKAIDRLTEELQARPGVTAVFIHIGANDIALAEDGDVCRKHNSPVSADELIAGHRALIETAHEHGVEAIGLTVIPTGGAVFPFTDDAGEQIRAELNEWIRTSGEYDHVVDAADELADPAAPGHLLPGYVSEDGLHPNEAGHLALSASVDLDSL